VWEEVLVVGEAEGRARGHVWMEGLDEEVCLFVVCCGYRHHPTDLMGRVEVKY